MTKLSFVQGDITKIAVDAIVNASNNALLEGGGVSGAIYRAASDDLFDECAKLGGCATGEAKITKSCGLPTKYIIHTAGPVYGMEDGKEEELLANCYRNSLKLAKECSLKTVAFPAISTGAFRYPKEAAAQIAIKTVRSFINENPAAFDEILFVLYDKGNLEIYQSKFIKEPLKNSFRDEKMSSEPRQGR